MKSNLQFF